MVCLNTELATGRSHFCFYFEKKITVVHVYRRRPTVLPVSGSSAGRRNDSADCNHRPCGVIEAGGCGSNGGGGGSTEGAAPPRPALPWLRSYRLRFAGNHPPGRGSAGALRNGTSRRTRSGEKLGPWSAAESMVRGWGPGGQGQCGPPTPPGGQAPHGTQPRSAPRHPPTAQQDRVTVPVLTPFVQKSARLHVLVTGS